MFFFFHFHFFRQPPTDPSRLSHLRFSMSHRDAIRAMLPRHSKSQPTNTLPGLLDSALRSKRLRIMDRMNGRTRSISLLLSPPHPTLASLSDFLRRDLRPLRFNLARHYYVFHRDFALVKFRPHNLSVFGRAKALTIHLSQIPCGLQVPA